MCNVIHLNFDNALNNNNIARFGVCSGMIESERLNQIESDNMTSGGDRDNFRQKKTIVNRKNEYN